MNIEYAKIDEVNALLTIVAGRDDFKDEIKKQMKELARTRHEPGFRPGHTPMALLEKKYGKAVRYDVIDKRISRELFDYIQKEQLRVLGNPVADSENLPNLDAEEIVFRFKLGLAPELDFKVEDVEVPVYNLEATDDMVERQDQLLRRRYGKQENGDVVEADSLVKGSMTQLDADGKPVEGGIRVDSGILAPEHFTSQAQKDLFLGKNLGAAVVFNPWDTCDGNDVELSSMLHITKEQAHDLRDNFQMDIAEIIVLRRAEPGQEYYDQVFGKDQVHNDEEYKEALRKMVASQLANDTSYRFTIDARECLMKAAGDFPLPDAVLKEYLKQQNEELTDETVDEEYAKAVPGLRWQLVSDAAAKTLDLKLTEDDLRSVAAVAVRNQFAQYGMASAPDDLVAKYSDEMLKDEKVRERLATQAVDTKLFNAIRAKAKVQEKTVTVDEFNALFALPDAEPAEPAE